jgi:hypothetical protein
MLPHHALHRFLAQLPGCGDVAAAARRHGHAEQRELQLRECLPDSCSGRCIQCALHPPGSARGRCKACAYASAQDLGVLRSRIAAATALDVDAMMGLRASFLSGHVQGPRPHSEPAFAALAWRLKSGWCKEAAGTTTIAPREAAVLGFASLLLHHSAWPVLR